jgi:hypothetical protein
MNHFGAAKTIDAKHLSPGSYLLHIPDGGRKTFRFIRK